MSYNPAVSTARIDISVQKGIHIVQPLDPHVTLDTARRLLSVLTELTANQPLALIIDLTRTLSICSEGLTAVSSCWKKAQAGSSLKLAVAVSAETNPEVMNLFDITGISTMMGYSIQPTVRDAILFMKKFMEE